MSEARSGKSAVSIFLRDISSKQLLIGFCKTVPWMIKRGEYRIVQALSITESLGSQLENSPKEDGVYKCLAEDGQRQLVLYFVDGVDFGQNSAIELLADLCTPLIHRDEYRVLERTPLAHEVGFVRRLRDGKGAGTREAARF